MSTVEQSQLISTSAPNAMDAESTSADWVFALFVTAFLIVDVGLVVLFIEAWDLFARHLSLPVLAGLFGAIVLAARVGLSREPRGPRAGRRFRARLRPGAFLRRTGSNHRSVWRSARQRARGA